MGPSAEGPVLTLDAAIDAHSQRPERPSADEGRGLSFEEGAVVDVEAVAESIWSAAQRGVYYPPEWWDKLSVDDGYRVQLGLLGRRLRAGDVQAGWKVGLTAKAMQLQIGVHEPVFGFLLGSGARPSATVFAFDELIRPGFENELCLTIGTTLQGPGVTLEAARASITAVRPAFEIIETRGPTAEQLALTLADNSQQHAFVTGDPTLRPVEGFKLSEATVEVMVNGQRMERASGAVLGDPAASVAWLANKLVEFGHSLQAGMQVMSGSFTRQYPLAAGDRIEARFEPFGVVTAEFH